MTAKLKIETSKVDVSAIYIMKTIAVFLVAKTLKTPKSVFEVLPVRDICRWSKFYLNFNFYGILASFYFGDRAGTD